jgi:PAS domain S-box-containing protein
MMKGAEEFFFKFFHNNLVGMILTDADHRIVDINDYLLLLADLPREDAIGKTGLELGILSEDFVQRIWQQMSETGKLSNIEHTLVSKKGKNITILFSTERIETDAGEYWLSTIIDFSTKKEAEIKIANSELRFRTLAKAAPVGIFETDANGNTTYVNEAWMEYSGLSYDEAMNNEWMNMIHPEDREMQVSAWYDKTKKGEASFSEYRIINKAGQVRWVNGGAIPIGNSEGVITGYIGTLSDVTNIKQALELLKRSHEILNERTQQLHELSSYLQQVREDERLKIAREIHDELGQQLTGLKMDLSWLKRKIHHGEEAVNNKFDDALSLIAEAVSSIRHMVTKLRPSILDDLGLNAAFEWQVEEFSKRLHIRIGYQNDFDDTAIDPNIAIGLFRILQESLTNIARHANANKILISIEKLENRVCLTIQDDGVGFDPAAKKTGHTFGLLGIKERTYMLKGDCQINSKPGNGTTISVQIPVS